MGMTVFYLIFVRLDLTPIGIGATVAWLLLGRAIRGWSHLRRHPVDILILPVVALTVIFIALPIKLLAFVTMNKQGWLTRHSEQVGGDGQTARTLSPQALAVHARPLEPARGGVQA
jgi:hypothetical protein